MKNVIISAKDKKTGQKFRFTLNDLYGYEGEVCGVFIEASGIPLNFNSGYGFNGMNPDLEIIDAELVDMLRNR